MPRPHSLPLVLLHSLYCFCAGAESPTGFRLPPLGEYRAMKLGLALVVATAIAAFAISVMATKDEDCRRERGDRVCHATYWFNR
jgi:hypothetical protein